MVYRYLQHTRIDGEERNKLYAIALLRRTDQPATMSAALGLTPEEAKTQYKETLNHLHRRYSFIFTEKGEPSLHQEVHYFLRLFLLKRRKQPETLSINTLLKEAHQTALDALEQQRAYQTLKERMQDDEWTGIYLDLAEQLFWVDPHEGFRYLLPFMVAGSVYKREINEEAELIGDFFANTLSVREQNRWIWAARSLVFSYSYNPLSEELQGLEELSKLFSQEVKLPTLLNYPKELQAALWWRLGEAYLTSDTMKAVQWYEKASNQLPEEEEMKEALAEAWYQQGTDHLLAKHYEESISALSRAIELSPTHVNAYINRGVTYYDQKEYAKAIADYDAVLRLDSNYIDAYINRGVAYYDQQKYIQAIANYETLMHLDPNNVFAHYNRGLAYYAQLEYAKAIIDLDTVIRLDKNYIDAYNYRGLVYYAQQKYSEAIADYDTALRLNPDYTITYYNRGLVYGAQQDYTRAIDDYTRALNLGYEPNIHLARGYVYLWLKDIEKAMEDFEQAARKNPDDVNSVWMPLFVSLTKGRPGLDVAEQLEKVATIDLQRIEAQVSLGVALGLRGKLKEGLAQLDGALKQNATSQDALFWKGMLCAYYYRSRPPTGNGSSREGALHRTASNLASPSLLAANG